MENKYSGMPRAELEALKMKLQNDREALLAEQKLVAAALMECDVFEELDKMPDVKKDMLRQILKPVGIDSSERMGKPGA